MRHTIASGCVLTAILTACGGDVPNAIQSSSSTITAPHLHVVTDYHAIVQQLYVAYFGRPADPTGLANFGAALNRAHAPINIQTFNQAYSNDPAIRGLVDSFGTSEESESLYSGDTVAFVTAIYRNVLNRAPDRAGLDFWTTAIDRGGLTRANASFSIMAGALANQTPQGQVDARLINQRVTAALNFTHALSTPELVSAYSGNRAAAIARYMLSLVTENSDAAAIQQSIGSTIPLLTGGTLPPAPAPDVAAESANGTTILPGSSAVIVDFRGQAWGVTADGKIVVNGLVDQSTEKVERLIYQNNIQGRTVWQQANAQRYWWQWDYSSQSWIFMGENGYTAPAPAPAPAPSVFESQINGTFNGWTGNTVVTLTNGQVWRQSSYYYYYYYSFMPRVSVYPSNGQYYMSVDRTQAVPVIRVR